ncbi:hypothetical protein MKK01_26655 (plasmid) [Klebsiella variicola subsp. variicola]|uniref:hypothetical protein n=1 Tax=Klebsiella TaxID=570 RepID=UPI0013A53ED7|nr:MULTISPECIES: hypothetical protein [Klebsiella]EKX4242666.1 hypothetical protein [Klebsiella pneumoniae]QLX18585.1 hypothetical protein HV230_28995 [Klebsiella oxytoca]ELA1114748.1 hypothetical protein [Klebsiella pneumoniae]MDU7883575.1 hypothetical protein [Klebsiella michiganensis]UML91850.1 hypothetical protein MKK01_26655 [Klebsiella variicola subsp. variicola]
MKSISTILLTVVLLAAIVFGGVSLKAQSLKVSKFEAQGLELNFQGVVPRTKQ